MILSDKNSGLRPIGVGEGLRRITGKVIATHVRGVIVTSVGSFQVSAEREAACESLTHAMSTIYEEQSGEAVGRCIKCIQIC